MVRYDTDQPLAPEVAERVLDEAAGFGVPEGYEPVGGITVGHRHPDLAPQDAQSIEHRRRTDEVVHRGHR